MATGAYFKKEQMNVLQNFQTLAYLMSKALGGKKKKGQPVTPDRVHNISSASQLEQAIRGMTNGRG